MQLAFNFDEVETKETVEEVTENPHLDGLTEEDIAKQIEQEIGIKFKQDGKYWKYQKNKSSKVKLEFYLGNYDYYSKPNLKGVHHMERYIGVDYQYNHGGEGRGVGTVEEAINFFKGKLSKEE